MSKYFKKTSLLAASVLTLTSVSAVAGDAYIPPLPTAIPSNPNAGECYARVEVPARYDNRTQQVLVQDGYTEYQVQQPSISSRAQDVMVKEPSVEYRVRQPRYSTVTEQMMVRPAYEKLQVSPPEFQTITETQQVTGPRLVWKKGNPATLRAQGYVIHSTADGGPQGRGYHSTTQYGANRSEATLCGTECEIWCLVEEPGEAVSYTRRVMTKPSTVHRVPVQARYQSITKQVLVDPGGVEEIPVPAKYQTVMVEDVMPARAMGGHEVPPQYDNINVKVPVEEARYEWRRVICDTGVPLTPMTPAPQPVPQISHGSSTSYGGYNSGYVAPPANHVPAPAPAPSYQHHGAAQHAYEGVVCNKGDKRKECYGHDVIQAYERSQQYSGSQQHHGGASHAGNPHMQYEHGGQSTYDKATGLYQDGRRAHDAYETVNKRVKRRHRR